MNTIVHCAQEPDNANREIVGETPALKTAFNLVSVVAPADPSVLILGGTGTGKADIHYPSVTDGETLRRRLIWHLQPAEQFRPDASFVQLLFRDVLT